jgi:hypothetical protein
MRPNNDQQTQKNSPGVHCSVTRDLAAASVTASATTATTMGEVLVVSKLTIEVIRCNRSHIMQNLSPTFVCGSAALCLLYLGELIRRKKRSTGITTSVTRHLSLTHKKHLPTTSHPVLAVAATRAALTLVKYSKIGVIRVFLAPAIRSEHQTTKCHLLSIAIHIVTRSSRRHSPVTLGILTRRARRIMLLIRIGLIRHLSLQNKFKPSAPA